MATQAERLQKIKDLQNPDKLIEDVLAFLSSRIETHDVEPLVPEKGVDYFTPYDIDEIVSIVKPMIKDGVDGADGIDGIDGKDGKDGRDGKDGKDGRDGKDGVSPDIKEVINAVLKLIPKPKDGVSPDPKDIAKQAVGIINNNPDQQFVTVKQLADFLRRGGFRGGAGSGTGTTQTVYSDTVAGTIDGINTVFTVSTNINTAFTLYLANSIYQPIVDFTYSGTTITMLVAPDASLSGQPFWLLHN